MLVGVMSDTHDNVPAIEKAVRFLNDHGVNFAIHAGDFIAPFSLKPLEDLRCPWIGVFGNNDGEKAGLTTSSQGRIQPVPYELNLDGKKVVVMHELDPHSRQKFLDKGTQLVIHGHTHQPEVTKEQGILFVNPGEVGAWLHGKSTVAIVDMSTLEATIETL